MSESASENSSKPRFGCWLIGFAVLSLLVISRLAWFWYLSEPKRQLTIGRETTWLDGPVSSDGYVDYLAGINQRQSDGVTVDNNAVPLLIRAYGPQFIVDAITPKYFELLGVPRPFEGVDTLIDESAFIKQSVGQQDAAEATNTLNETRETASRRPWTRAEFPELAALLDANSAPLAVVAEASVRPRFYSPLVSPGDSPSMFSVLLPVEQQQRSASRLLTARAMLKLGEGDPAGAWEDLLTCHRLARLTGQSPFIIGALVSYSIEAVALEADQVLIASPALTPELARKCLSDVAQLPPLPSMADCIDSAERLALLDAAVLMARNPGGLQLMSGDSPAPALSGSIDWNIVLELINDEFDKAVAAMRLPDTKSRVAEVDKVVKSPVANSRQVMALGLRSFLGNRQRASRDLGWSILKNYLPAISTAMTSENRAIAREELLRTGFALAAWQREHGTYPQALQELVPSLLPAVPIDPWSGQELLYRPTADGFVLYSVADDMQDNGGHPLDPRMQGTASNRNWDIVFRVGSE